MGTKTKQKLWDVATRMSQKLNKKQKKIKPVTKALQRRLEDAIGEQRTIDHTGIGAAAAVTASWQLLVDSVARETREGALISAVGTGIGVAAAVTATWQLLSVFGSALG
ncbi:hypothetical protein L6452_22785 [Arctium lappa]|uniref:Uncharacterized protein n=1 Tax=Arctium lappa TaxID=4217 RepID=A0ACB9B149_ARCLA|nr:hypothetical protein L6452_22785 [Arctium lappa]